VTSRCVITNRVRIHRVERVDAEDVGGTSAATGSVGGATATASPRSW
jgi:hypothetical protein